MPSFLQEERTLPVGLYTVKKFRGLQGRGCVWYIGVAQISLGYKGQLVPATPVSSCQTKGFSTVATISTEVIIDFVTASILGARERQNISCYNR